MDYKREQMQRRTDQESLAERAEIIAREESPEDTASILHDLRVHQIELELQNEALRKTQEELDTLRFLYFEIFELAPVGYIILSAHQLIIDANLTSAALLGVSKNELKNQKISRFISKQHQDIFYLYIRRLFDGKMTQNCEVEMIKPDGSSFWVQFVGTPRQDINGELVYLNIIHPINCQKD